jgi:hypothetical protein
MSEDPAILQFSSNSTGVDDKYQFLDTQAQNQQVTLKVEIPNKTSAMYFFQEALSLKIQVFWGQYAVTSQLVNSSRCFGGLCLPHSQSIYLG